MPRPLTVYDLNSCNMALGITLISPPIFGNGCHAEALPQSDNGRHDLVAPGMDVHRLYETGIDLQLVDGKASRRVRLEKPVPKSSRAIPKPALLNCRLLSKASS